MKDKFTQVYILLIMYLFCFSFYLAMERRTPKQETPVKAKKIIWINQTEIAKAKKDSIQKLNNDLWKKLQVKHGITPASPEQ